MPLKISNSWLVLFTAFCGQSHKHKFHSIPYTNSNGYQTFMEYIINCLHRRHAKLLTFSGYPCSKCCKTYQSLTRKEMKWKIYNHTGSEAIQISNMTNFTQWKKPPIHITQKAGWSHKLWTFWRRDLLSLPGVELWFLRYSTHGLITVPTTLPWLPLQHIINIESNHITEVEQLPKIIQHLASYHCINIAVKM